MVDSIPVPETAKNVDQTAGSNTEQPSSTNIAENDNHEKTGNTERRRVQLNVDPVIHQVAAHISDRFLDVGLRPYPTEVLTTNYNQHLFSNLSGLEEKINIGNVTDVPNGTVPYSYRIVPLPKSCEHSDWH
uniref:Uncharacterized protein n=1 Tax=Panagrolaimus sp. JU765 TaxID=591449 RepID=A0AC34RH30_9BILA